jgi:hypothetical protein
LSLRIVLRRTLQLFSPLSASHAPRFFRPLTKCVLADCRSRAFWLGQNLRNPTNKRLAGRFRHASQQSTEHLSPG